MDVHSKITGKFPLDPESVLEGIIGKGRVALGVPFIYSFFLPMVVFDICLEIYHHACFTLFEIPKVDRKEYFIFDRHKLPYLTAYEKLNCLYCSYFNNLIAYAREIGARTERHWCPIKHALNRLHQHDHYHKFFEYNSADRYQREKKLLRKYDNEADKISA